jgi:hypothetical protein
VTTSSFNFVDLAGSERASKSGASGNTLKEGSMINRSLTTLGTVIRNLAAKSAGDKTAGHIPYRYKKCFNFSSPISRDLNTSRKAKLSYFASFRCKTRQGRGGQLLYSHSTFGHIPYRDSKLTRLLQSCLGGNSHTVSICNITHADAHVDETKSSLRFASFAKTVVNKASKNVAVTTAELLKQYKSQINELKAQLTQGVDENRMQLKEQMEREQRSVIEGEMREEVNKVRHQVRLTFV